MGRCGIRGHARIGRQRACDGTVYSYSPASPFAARPMLIDRKLAILADAAKYDASCASSGTTKRSSIGGKGIGSTEGSGICHSYAPDGRCISLLKILLTNFCVYDCLYCVNRVTSNVRAGALHGRGGRRPHARLLSPQLHRGPVPQLGNHPLGRLHDGAGRRGRALAARGPRLSRLHPPEDDPRGQPRAARARRPLCRPPQHQHRAADDAIAGGARAGKGRRRDPPLDGAAAHPHRRCEGRGPAAAGRVAADDRRRGGRGRRASRRPARARR